LFEIADHHYVIERGYITLERNVARACRRP
jgi:hypothetical protein